MEAAGAVASIAITAAIYFVVQKVLTQWSDRQEVSKVSASNSGVRLSRFCRPLPCARLRVLLRGTYRVVMICMHSSVPSRAVVPLWSSSHFCALVCVCA